ncbi:aminoglycoside adenylyltransferase domain-containing protein [Nocardia cyriacigeorgica]|uniref:aminoglycoside adenylyltransferase domain-containing protein n=1 Tax=Nocardia cyriacigeorgica TaxID=135487 RepID=UPI0024548AC2|nr:aminoglycoside adenylyltransferase domain-containing protein [Nocardia cyriacigeorgica]
MTIPDITAARSAAEQLAQSCARIIGPATRSVILHGSLATGDFRPGRSDIDLLLLTDIGPTDEQRAALERSVRQADLGDASGIDLHLVLADVARTPTPTPPAEFHIGRYDGSSLGVEVQPPIAADPDLPAELSMARQDGSALIGEAPAEAIAPIPPEWIRDRGRYWLTTWRTRTDDAEDAALMVLTACRSWYFADTERHTSKAAAARWVLEQDPSLSAVRQALHQYLDDPEAHVDPHGIAQVLDTVLRETD